MADLKNRKVLMFRCHLDPMVGAKSKNAFHRKDVGPDWIMELSPAGVYVRSVVKIPGSRLPVVREHLVPFSNIQSIEFEPLPEEEEKKVA